jgi:DNA polymerase III epsilon subunit-like protein
MNAKTIIYPSSYVVWDLETSGLDSSKSEILEIACVTVRQGEVVDKWSALLNHNIDIDPEVSKIHGITKEMCAAEGIDPKEAMRKLVEAIYDAPAHVTHNGSRFDVPFLESKFDQEKLKDQFIAGEWDRAKRRHIDTAALFKGAKMNVFRDWNESLQGYAARVMDMRVYGLKYNVGVCCDELGISREGVQQHRALADVLLTNEIYKKLVL